MSDDLSTTCPSDSEADESFSYISDEPPGSMQVTLNVPDDYHVMSANVQSNMYV